MQSINWIPLIVCILVCNFWLTSCPIQILNLHLVLLCKLIGLYPKGRFITMNIMHMHYNTL